MAKSNISSSKKTISKITSKHIYTHTLKPDIIPSGLEYINIEELVNSSNTKFETIVIADTLDYVQYNQAMVLLDNLIDKLDNGGKLIIQGPDLYQLCSAGCFQDIDIDTIKLILFNGKQNVFTNYDIQKELEARGIMIVEKRFINIFEYYIKAVKV